MSRPVVAFRTEGGANVGLGHVRRCMTLAKALQHRGLLPCFVVNKDPSVGLFLRRHGFAVMTVESQDNCDLGQTLAYVQRWDAQTLVIDSYSIQGKCFEDRHQMALVVLDDLADRGLPVDVVVNGAANASELHYRTAPRTKLLLGPRYALLREEFQSTPVRSIRERVERILITVGGTDATALSPRLVTWTLEVLGQVAIDLVIGPLFSSAVCRDIELVCRDSASVTVHRELPNMHKLMVSCDLAVTGGGQTTYELAASGTPALAVKLANNQTGNLAGLSAAGALIWVGGVEDADLEDKMKRSIVDVADDAARRASLCRAGRALVDGRGASRVSTAILSLASSSQA